MNIEDFKVACCVVTYNQEHYISQALDSILAQQTDFPVDIIVGNDCSTDNTTAILTNYAAQYDNIVVLNATENGGIVRNTVNVFRYIFEHEEYKYVAMLDGDDWWCDNQKLQLQVEYMEKHPDYSFIFTRCGTFSEKTQTVHHSKPANVDRGGQIFPILMRMGISNCTILHRTQMLRNINWEELIEQNLFSCDYPTNVFMAVQGPVGFLDRETAIWRRTGNTVSSPATIEKALTYCEHEIRQGRYLAEKFPNTPYANFTKVEQERHRQQRRYELALANTNYDLLTTIDWNYVGSGIKPWYAYNRLSFMIYKYIIKKCITLFKIIKIQLFKNTKQL